MTVVFAGLLTLETTVQKSRTPEAWKEEAHPKFREQGKMGLNVRLQMVHCR
jgi:hypothetical protein